MKSWLIFVRRNCSFQPRDGDLHLRSVHQQLFSLPGHHVQQASLTVGPGVWLQLSRKSWIPYPTQRIPHTCSAWCRSFCLPSRPPCRQLYQTYSNMRIWLISWTVWTFRNPALGADPCPCMSLPGAIARTLLAIVPHRQAAGSGQTCCHTDACNAWNGKKIHVCSHMRHVQ